MMASGSEQRDSGVAFQRLRKSINFYFINTVGFSPKGIALPEGSKLGYQGTPIAHVILAMESG